MQSDILFRCSSLGRLMTEPRSKSESLSETAKALCLEMFIERKYKRRKKVESKYMTKGITNEEIAITSFNVHLIKQTGKFIELVKNTERRQNDFIIGEPDICNHILADIKNCWDIFTFFDAKTKALNKDYFWQLQGYMWLFDFDTANLVYTLENTPKDIMEREMRFKESAEESDFIFDDIPAEERIHIINVERDDACIEALKEKVLIGREYITKLN